MAKNEKLFRVIVMLWAIILEVSTEDRDSEMCDCPETLAPVCSSNKKVFNNSCHFHCYRRIYPSLRVVGRSFCASCVIPASNEPVCGSNGVIYMNLMQFECDRKAYPEYHLKLKELRYCTICDCPRFSKEAVCGSDGRLYDNRCELECFKRVYPEIRVVEVAMDHCVGEIFV
ncbi:serine protease inhibitor dipetalogastin-like [Coccinella septempunctata]|uniref:serine protease inhibitor dipetalogastin-like n=1 Tax=Coccinella septempunctata TaxID=41139 RepID=UPI001D08E9E5|nr:serine protease inhibitor dipetalogastin-like [Coccinella septempunctata]